VDNLIVLKIIGNIYQLYEPIVLWLAMNHIQIWFYLLTVKLGFRRSRRHASHQTEYGTRAYHSSV